MGDIYSEIFVEIQRFHWLQLSESAKLRVLRVKNVITCQRALRDYVLTCQRILLAFMLTRQPGLHDYVFTYQYALGSLPHIAC